MGPLGNQQAAGEGIQASSIVADIPGYLFQLADELNSLPLHLNLLLGLAGSDGCGEQRDDGKH